MLVLLALRCATTAPSIQRNEDLAHILHHHIRHKASLERDSDQQIDRDNNTSQFARDTDKPTGLPKQWWDSQIHLQKEFDELENVHYTGNNGDLRHDFVENDENLKVPKSRGKRSLSRECRDPSDLEKRYQDFLFSRELYPGSEIVYRSPDYVLLHMKDVQQVSDAQHSENFQGHVDESDTCPYQINTEAVEPRMRSECPWHYVPDIDPNRYPRIMQFAKCECKKCLGRHGHSHGCEVTWYNVRVLRRTGRCVSGIYIYEPVLEPIPVACVCAHTRS